MCLDEPAYPSEVKGSTASQRGIPRLCCVIHKCSFEGASLGHFVCTKYIRSEKSLVEASTYMVITYPTQVISSLQLPRMECRTNAMFCRLEILFSDSCIMMLIPLHMIEIASSTC